MLRRNAVLLVLVGLFGFFVSYVLESQAQRYPDRPIQVVVPFGAGGPADLIARLVGDPLGKELKVPVAILNKVGAGGAIGTSSVAQARKDGYTLMMTTHASFLTAILQPKDVSYDMERDFEPIGKVTDLATTIMVRGDAPWKTLSELFNHIRKNPKKLSCGIAPIGTMPYFVWAAMNSIGFETNAVITATTPEDIALLKGGHIDIMIESVHSCAPYFRDKSFRGLAVTTLKRVKEFPEIPTFPEAGYPEIGYFPQFAGLFAPTATPQPILQTLSSALQKAMKAPTLADKLDKMNYSADYQGPAEFKQMIHSFIPKIGAIAEKAGIIK